MSVPRRTILTGGAPAARGSPVPPVHRSGRPPSAAESAWVVQFADNGTPDHDWEFPPDAGGYFRIRDRHSDKVHAVDRMSTEDSTWVVQFADTGTPDHLWGLW